MGKKKQKIWQTETPRQGAFDAAWAKFRPLVPSDELAEVEKSFGKPLCTTFRLNPLKTDQRMVGKMSERYGWELEEIPFCSEGFRVRLADVLPSQTNEHRMGHYYIQDSASMLPVTLYDEVLLKDHPLILDMAASPGGKTTHLISRTMDSGLVIANDSSLSRIQALKTVLKNWGSLRQAIVNFPGESFGAWFPNTFDLILLDAPCSMQSLVSIDSHPMRPITEREEKALAQRQTALLESALRALKPGGQIVYSTCTLSPDEDESVVDSVLKTFGSSIRVLDAGKRLPWPAPGLTETASRQFDPSLAGTVRLWPHRYETAGFFAALLQKDDFFDSEPGEPPERSFDKSSFSAMKPQDADGYTAWLKDQFDLDVAQILGEMDLSLWMRGEEVWMLPNDYIERFSFFPSRSIGMRSAVRTSVGWVPDNEWVSRFYGRTHGLRICLNAEEVSQWVQGSDIRPEGIPSEKGAVVCLTDETGVFVGCGRVSGDRVRNFVKR